MDKKKIKSDDIHTLFLAKFLDFLSISSHLKKEKVFMYGRVGCHIAIYKGKDVATLIPDILQIRK